MKNARNLPKLRFPEFREAGEWKSTIFGKLGLDVSDGNYSAKYPRQSDFLKTGIPFLRANNLRFGSISDEDIRFISEKQHKEIKKGHLKRGDILLSTRGQIGTVALVPDRHVGSNINAQLVRINTGNKLINTFLFQLLDFLRVNEIFEALSTGTALKQLPVGKLNRLKLNIPELKEEQQKIADCLSSLDDRITAETQKLDILKAHKKGLMQQLFPAEGETLPKLRFPEFQDAEEWRTLSLGAVAEFIDSLHETPKQYVETGYPMVRVADVKESGLHLDCCLKVTEEVYSHFVKRYIPQKGDIIFSRVGSCGESVLIDFNEKICLGQNTILLKAKESHLFLFLYLKSDLIKKQVDNKVVGSSYKTLSLKDAKAFDICLPCKKEQQKIADCLSLIADLIAAQMQKIDTLKTHKKGLMQQLFPSVSGEK